MLWPASDSELPYGSLSPIFAQGLPSVAPLKMKFSNQMLIERKPRPITNRKRNVTFTSNACNSVLQTQYTRYMVQIL